MAILALLYSRHLLVVIYGIAVIYGMAVIFRSSPSEFLSRSYGRSYD